MDVSKMKNMVVLKNLPSNIVDEAFVVLKSNKKVKNFEKAQSVKKSKDNDEEKKDSEYMLKEAEMLVADYILKMEDKQQIKSKGNNKKQNNLKTWATISTVIAFIEGIFLFVL